MDIDWEQLAVSALRAHNALIRIDRRKQDPTWRSIMIDLRMANSHRSDLTSATASKVERILTPKK